ALHPFGLLVATGVIIGTYLATSRARKMGLDLDRLNSFITWMLVAGFIGGHMLDDIFYHPDEIAKNPLRLITLWEGLSSFGGFAVSYPTRFEVPDPLKFALVDGHAPRFDLGLLEMLFTCIIAACFAITWHKKLPTGMYVAVVSLAYAPVRFVMDFIRLKPND